jgi:hypothetical protein
LDRSRLIRRAEGEWELPRSGAMRVPGILYADEALLDAMDDKVAEQVANVAALPGIVKASFAMPDAHWGYGFPIGGVAAFDPDAGGVVSAGGVGFDISCGVRTLTTGLIAEEVEPVKRELADMLYARIPAGVGSTGALSLSPAAHAGQSAKATAARRTWIASRNAGSLAGPIHPRCRMPPSSASATRWARSAPAITISRCSAWRRSTTRPSLKPTASSATRS